MNLTFEILSYILAGLLLGYYLDKSCDSMPINMIILTIIGFIGAIYKISIKK